MFLKHRNSTQAATVGLFREGLTGGAKLCSWMSAWKVRLILASAVTCHL